MADEELNVTIEPETPEPDTVVKPEPQPEPKKAEAKEEPASDLAEQFKRLEEQNKQDRVRLEAAERQAASDRAERERLGKEVTQAREEVADREADSILTGLAAAQAAADAAGAEYERAFEAGDAKAMAAANRKIARAESDAGRLEEAKSNLEVRKAQRAKEPADGRVERPVPTDDFDRYLSQFTPTTRDWLRDHREWVTDTRKNSKLVAAHHDAVSEGLQTDSDEYFEHVETFIGLRAKTDPLTPPKPEKKVEIRRRVSAPVAPVQATGGGMNGGNEVRLTAGQAQAATDGTITWNYDDPSGQKRFKKGDPVGVQEYARRTLEQKKQGLHDRSYVES